nr:unnamed protein product [Digitaria exilis]
MMRKVEDPTDPDDNSKEYENHQKVRACDLAARPPPPTLSTEHASLSDPFMQIKASPHSSCAPRPSLVVLVPRRLAWSGDPSEFRLVSSFAGPNVSLYVQLQDETTLVWYSHSKEKYLVLSSVCRIIPGQRTAVFRRFLRPEKDYLSFSLIYKNGQRSLDLVCKDQAEVEVWFSTLETLITSTPGRKSYSTDGPSDRLSVSEVACGHTMTIALATSGHVFTMGSSSNGQLGNPKSDETSSNNSYSKRNVIARRSVDSKDKSERPEIRPSRLATGSPAEQLKQAETKSVRNEIKPDPMSMMKAPQVPSMLPFNGLAFGGTFGPTSMKPMTMAAAMPMAMPMSPSPLTKKPHPPATTPLCGKSDTDNLKRTKDVLNEDISKLQSQVNKLKQKCDAQEEQLQKTERRAENSASLAAEESSRRNRVLEFIKFLDNELKSIADRVPSEAADSLKALQNHSEIFLSGQGIHPPDITNASGNARAHQRSASMGNLMLAQDGSSGNASSSVTSLTSESPCHRIMENSLRANGDFAPKHGTHGEVQLIEQFEPGVYVTLIQLRDGTNVFKRVRFR